MAVLQIQSIADLVDTSLEKPILSSASAKKQSILRFIQQEIAILKHNWDGYDALPIEQKVLLNARFLIHQLPNKAINLLEKEAILPNSNGTISIEWINNQNELFLEIGNDYSTYYLKNSGKIQKINNQFIMTDNSEFQQFINDFNTL